MPLQTSLRVAASGALARLTAGRPAARARLADLGWAAPEERVRWFGARTNAEAVRALAHRAGASRSPRRDLLLLVGADGPLRQALVSSFRRHGWDYRLLETLAPLPDGVEEGRIACVVAADVEPERIMDVARGALKDPRLAAVPVEWVTGLEPQHLQFARQDDLRGQHFVSPLLVAEPSPYALYDESLHRFEQKCSLRDYLDLYQLIVSVHERAVRGDVAEFGSYRGHSGWLIARTLEGLGSDRTVHLFDTFDRFPAEPEGIDRFWSGTHEVSLEEVRRQLAGLSSVRLVAGEFQDTVPSSGIAELALAYVDCDSHRAVAYLARELFENHLTPGGVIVFEDYGHPALLGCRVAVHDFFDGRTDCVRFFSQFSGLYIVIKADA